MKTNKSATGPLCVFLALAAFTAFAMADLEGVAPEPEGGWASRAFCISAPATNDVPRFCSFVKSVLAPSGVDTLVLLVRYNYRFKSHPECGTKGGLSPDDARAIREACASVGMRIVPKMNLLGHQGERHGVAGDGLLAAHPEMDESEGAGKVRFDYCRSLCPRHPDALRLVTDLADELAEAFGADALHIGCDEVFEIGRCERCKGVATAKIFADWVNAIARHLKTRGVKTMMWADRLLDSAKTPYGVWEASDNGTAGALGLVDRDVQMCDWHYEDCKTYPSVETLADAGYRMYVCPWRHAENAKKFLDYAVRHDRGRYLGLLFTTWYSARDVMDAFSGKWVSRDDASCIRAKSLYSLARNFRYLFPKARGIVPEFPEVEKVRQDEWWGGRRTVYRFRGRDAWVVEPKVKAMEGRPWTWTVQWWEAFVPRTSVPAMIEEGVHHVVLDMFDTRVKSDEALETMAAWQDFVTREYGLAPKARLIGMSWGGFISTRYAAKYPEKVGWICYDCPFLNFDDSPVKEIGPWAQDPPKGGRWTDDPRMPVNMAGPLARAGIRALVLYGGADRVVPPARNCELFVPRYKAAGGDIRVIRRWAYAHHPHGVEVGERTIRDFFLADVKKAEPASPKASAEATPESQGVSSRAILGWIDAVERENPQFHSFVLRRHGKVIAEGWWSPYERNEVHRLFSHSKVFTSTAAGFVCDEGKLDLDERVAAIFPEKLPANPNERVRDLRVRDLLTMNTGGVRDRPLSVDPEGDWLKAILGDDFKASEPGQRFDYNSCATYTVAEIVRKKTGRDMMDYLDEKLFRPLGITGVVTTRSPSGCPCGGWGMAMKTEDIAKLGQLFLDGGRWQGREIISPHWVQLATAKHTWNNCKPGQPDPKSDWQQGYGFQWWRCRHGCYRADGAGGQYTIVMPKEDAVLSVTALFGDFQLAMDHVWKHLLPAMKETSLPPDEAASKALSDRCAKLAIAPPGGTREPDASVAKRVTGRWKLKENKAGFSAFVFASDADGWKVSFEGGKFPVSFAVGYGAWRTSKVTLTDAKVDPLGRNGLLGDLKLASAGAWTGGRFAAEGWFTNEAARGRLEIDFSGDAPKGRVSYSGACLGERVLDFE